jgi:hypothetical protein
VLRHKDKVHIWQQGGNGGTMENGKTQDEQARMHEKLENV